MSSTEKALLKNIRTMLERSMLGRSTACLMLGVIGAAASSSSAIALSLSGTNSANTLNLTRPVLLQESGWVSEALTKSQMTEPGLNTILSPRVAPSASINSPSGNTLNLPSASANQAGRLESSDPSFAESDTLAYQVSKEYVSFASWLRGHTQETEFTSIVSSSSAGVNTRLLTEAKASVGGIDQTHQKVSVLNASEELVKESPYAFKDGIPDGKLPGSSLKYEADVVAPSDKADPVEMGVTGIAIWVVGLLGLQQGVRFLIKQRESS